MANYNIQISYFNSSGGYDNLYPQTLINNIADWNNTVYSKEEINQIVDTINTDLDTGVFYKIQGDGIPYLEECSINMSDYDIGDTVPILEKSGNDLVLKNYKVYAKTETTKSLIKVDNVGSNCYWDSNPSGNTANFFESDLYNDNMLNWLNNSISNPVRNILKATPVTCVTWEESSQSLGYDTRETTYYTLGRGEQDYNESYYENVLGQYVHPMDEYYWTMDASESRYERLFVYGIKNSGESAYVANVVVSEASYWIPIISVGANDSYTYYKDIQGNLFETQKYYSSSNLFVDKNGELVSGNIVLGSYIGTGDYGVNKPNQLQFPFVPKVVFINAKTGDETNASGVAIINGLTSGYGITFTWESTKISWYSTTNAEYQINKKNIVYYYIALV